MVTLDFSIEGTERISRRLNITAEGVRDFKTPLKQVGEGLLKTFDINFSSRGSLYGGWVPRKPQYRAGQRVDTWPLLERSGKMRRSFKQKTTSTSLELYNPTSYFVYHQSRAPRSNLPRRVMMKLRRQEADFLVKTFQRYLIEILRGRGER